jgi:hypothetical protein
MTAWSDPTITINFDDTSGIHRPIGLRPLDHCNHINIVIRCGAARATVFRYDSKISEEHCCATQAT